jgi:hypothetical protein
MIQSFFLFLVLALFLGSITLFSIKRLHGTEEELKKKNKELSRSKSLFLNSWALI